MNWLLNCFTRIYVPVSCLLAITFTTKTPQQVSHTPPPGWSGLPQGTTVSARYLPHLLPTSGTYKSRPTTTRLHAPFPLLTFPLSLPFTKYKPSLTYSVPNDGTGIPTSPCRASRSSRRQKAARQITPDAEDIPPLFPSRREAISHRPFYRADMRRVTLQNPSLQFSASIALQAVNCPETEVVGFCTHCPLGSRVCKKALPSHAVHHHSNQAILVPTTIHHHPLSKHATWRAP